MPKSQLTQMRYIFGALVAGLALLAGAVLWVVGKNQDRKSGRIWTQALDDDAPLSARSTEEVASLARQARYSPTSTPLKGYNLPGHQAVIQSGQYSVPVWTVPEGQPKVTVTLLGTDGMPRTEGDAYGLQDTWQAVPVPRVPHPQADGDDGHLVVYQPSTDTTWEFWRFSVGGTTARPTYSAVFGARIEHQSSSNGVLPNHWGARGTSLELLGGVLRMHEYLDGGFEHAVGLALPVVDDRVVPPATRSDGPFSATPGHGFGDALSEGMRFRLPASYACNRRAAPGLARMLCRAVRDYGFIVNDHTGGSVTVFAEDPRTVGTPYSDLDKDVWTQIDRGFSGPDAVLDEFPWDDLQRVAA